MTVGGRTGSLRSSPRRSRRCVVPTVLAENRDFRLFWMGQAVSLFGDQISLMALPLVAILLLGANAAQMGYLTAAGLAPYLLFPIVAGAWVDRRPWKRRIMLVADVVRALVLLSVPVAQVLGLLSLAYLYGAAFVVGSFSVLFFVSYNTVFVSLVPPGRYLEATSALAGARALSFLAGPSVGGLLVQALSAPLAVLADAFTFVGSGVLLSRVRSVEPAPAVREPRALLVGARFIWRSRVVGSALAATATVNFFNYVFLALFLLYATQSLGVQPAVLGLVVGAASMGGLLGSVVTGRLARRVGIGPAVLAGTLGFTAPLLLVPLAGGPAPLVLVMLFLAEFGSGLGVMILDISLGTVFAAVVPDPLRARVSGAYMAVNHGVRPLGSLLGGLLGTAVGVRSTLWIATLGAMAGILWLLPSPLARMRRVPRSAGASPEAVVSLH